MFSSSRLEAYCEFFVERLSERVDNCKRVLHYWQAGGQAEYVFSIWRFWLGAFELNALYSTQVSC